MNRTPIKEIAESWVNGNISWVKEEVTSIRTFNLVLRALEEMGQDTTSFRRIVGDR